MALRPLSRARNGVPPSIRMSRWSRRRWLGLLLVVGLAGLSLVGRRPIATDRSGVRGDDFGRYHGRTFRVARVVDGDTLDILAPDDNRETTRIRLWGVDTPEVAGTRYGAMYWGGEESAFAKEMLTGSSVRLELLQDRTRGRYGRLLAYIYLVTGKMFNELLLEQGFAYADPRFAHPLKSRFALLEADARADGRGLWGQVRREHMPKWRQQRERGNRD